MVSLHIFPVVAEGTDSAPAIADFTGSGHPEVLFQGNGAPPFILPADPGDQKWPQDPPNRLPAYHTDAGTQIGLDPTSLFGPGTKAFYPDTMFPLFSHPSIGDLDGDGVPDVIMTGGSLSLVGSLEGGHPGGAAQELAAMWSGATGHQMYGSPVPIEDFTFLVNEAVADITGDGYPEVILGTGGYFVRAFDACGCEAAKFPKFTGGWIIATPAVGDIEGDHGIEVVTGTRDGFLYAWHTAGTDTGVIQWESFHHDNQNTGNYATALGQGVLRAGTTPINCSLDCAAAPAAPTTTSSYSAGGCGCRTVSSQDERTGVFLVAVGLGLGALLARRRKR
jgi:MYXO-CTERM domain-containing protein